MPTVALCRSITIRWRTQFGRLQSARRTGCTQDQSEPAAEPPPFNPYLALPSLTALTLMRGSKTRWKNFQLVSTATLTRYSRFDQQKKTDSTSTWLRRTLTLD